MTNAGARTLIFLNLAKVLGRTMPASRISRISRQRLATAGLLGASVAVCAQPALADQNLMVADNGTVHCEASLKDLTRISLKGDQFASVSKVQTGNPAEDFQVVNEPLRGDIYLSVATGFDRSTLSFFGITRKGFVYKFVCTVAGEDARQVFVANADLEQPQPAGIQISANLSPQEAAARLIAAMYAQRPVEGYDISWRALAPVNVGTLRVQLVGQYVGAALTGKLLKLSNPSTKMVTLTEDQVGPSDAVAISITNPKLEPGQATTAFVVVRNAEQGGRP
jgi:conjugal transfer pilus assembly protein TraK